MPSSRTGVGPAPTAAACLAWWPHRQTGLVRSGGLRGELGSCSSCSKASLWQEGPPWAAAPAAGADGAPPLCQLCPCPDPGSILGGWGPPGEGLPWMRRWPRMGVV